MKAKFIISDYQYLKKEYSEEFDFFGTDFGKEIEEELLGNGWIIEENQATKETQIDYPLTMEHDVWVDGYEDAFDIKEICFEVDKNITTYYIEHK